MKWLKELFSRKAVPKLKPVEVITQARLGEMFLNAPDNPLWSATLAALDYQVQEEVDDALGEDLTNEQLRHRMGGVAGLLRFKRTLLDYEAEARLTQEQIEAAKHNSGNSDG